MVILVSEAEKPRTPDSCPQYASPTHEYSNIKFPTAQLSLAMQSLIRRLAQIRSEKQDRSSPLQLITRNLRLLLGAENKLRNSRDVARCYF